MLPLGRRDVGCWMRGRPLSCLVKSEHLLNFSTAKIKHLMCKYQLRLNRTAASFPHLGPCLDRRPCPDSGCVSGHHQTSTHPFHHHGTSPGSDSDSAPSQTTAYGLHRFDPTLPPAAAVSDLGRGHPDASGRRRSDPGDDRHRVHPKSESRGRSCWSLSRLEDPRRRHRKSIPTQRADSTSSAGSLGYAYRAISNWSL